MQLRFLDELRERQKSLAWRGFVEVGIARGEGLEVRKVPIQIGAQIVRGLIDLRDTGDHSFVAKVGAPPDPVCQQRIERMPIDKNQIGNSRTDRFQHELRYLRRMLNRIYMLQGCMAGINHGCPAWMEADGIPKIVRPSSNVLHQHLVYIPAS